MTLIDGIEWDVAPGLTPYDSALAEMEARAAGIRTVINIAPLTDDAARLGKMADIVIANETEFERLAGETGMGNAEREAAMVRLHGAEPLSEPARRYINRLSDLLWTMARWQEGTSIITKELS